MRSCNCFLPRELLQNRGNAFIRAILVNRAVIRHPVELNFLLHDIPTLPRPRFPRQSAIIRNPVPYPLARFCSLFHSLVMADAFPVMQHKMKSILQKSIDQGINLRGTRHAGMSGSELRSSNPALAAKWAAFIKRNKAQMVKEIAACVS